MLQLIEYDYIDYENIVFDIDDSKAVSSSITYLLKNAKKSKIEIINEISCFATYLKTRY